MSMISSSYTVDHERLKVALKKQERRAEKDRSLERIWSKFFDQWYGECPAFVVTADNADDIKEHISEELIDFLSDRAQILNLSQLKIERLPKFITWINCTSLDLSQNELEVLPDSIGIMGRLSKLNLSHNKLTTLPESMGQLRMLKVVLLNHNRLTSIPPWLLALNIPELNLKHNPLLK